MNIAGYIKVFLITFIPGIEVRGSIPYGIIVEKLPVLNVFFVGLFSNLLLAPFTLFFVNIFENFLNRFNWFKKYKEKTFVKGRSSLLKYGEFLGLLIFVGIPLPGTGAISGVVLMELLKIPRKLGLVAIWGGVLIASIIVTIASKGTYSWLMWAIKNFKP